MVQLILYQRSYLNNIALFLWLRIDFYIYIDTMIIG